LISAVAGRQQFGIHEALDAREWMNDCQVAIADISIDTAEIYDVLGY
jgi:hypothetical protein